jgi:hypothetical protein
MTGGLAVAAIPGDGVVAVSRPRRHRDDPDLGSRHRGHFGRARRSATQFGEERTPWSVLELLGAGLLVVVVFAHIDEYLGCFR